MFFFLLAPAASADQNVMPAPLHFVITMESGVFESGQSAHQTCDILLGLLALSTESEAPKNRSYCIERFLSQSQAMALESILQYDYHLHLGIGGSGPRVLIEKNPSTVKSELDIRHFEWNLTAPDLTTKLDTLGRILHRFAFFEKNQTLIRSFFVAQGSAIEGAASQIAFQDGNFIDKKTKNVLSPSDAVFQYVSESERHKSYLIAALETAAVLGFEATLYWGPWGEDDRDPYFDNNELGKKLSGDGYRFDDNLGTINALGHASIGGLIYLAGRSNGITSLEAFLVTFALSAVWESVIETGEVFSINDQILTPVAGTAIGEVLYQFGEYFSQNKNTITAAVINPFKNLVNEAFTHDQRERRILAEKYGFSSEKWHEFDIFAALGAGNKDPQAALGVRLDLTQIVEIGKAAHVRRFLRDTAFTEFAAQLKLTTSEVESVEASFYAALGGYFRYSAEINSDGKLVGSSFFVGPGTRYDVAKKQDDNSLGWFATVHVLGPTVDYIYFHSRGYFRARLEVYPDFALVHSSSWEKYSDQFGDEGARSVLKKRGYYYGYGLSMMPRIELQYDDYNLAVQYLKQYVWSIDGRDISDEDLSDQELCDSISELSAKLSRKLPRLPLWVFMRMDRRTIESCIHDRSDGTVRDNYQTFGGFLGFEIKWK